MKRSRARRGRGQKEKRRRRSGEKKGRGRAELRRRRRRSKPATEQQRLLARSARRCLNSSGVCVFGFGFYFHVSAVVATLLRMRDAEESKGRAWRAARGERKLRRREFFLARRQQQQRESLNKPAIFSFIGVAIHATCRHPFARRARSQRTSGRASRLAEERNEEEKSGRFGRKPLTRFVFPLLQEISLFPFFFTKEVL